MTEPQKMDPGTLRMIYLEDMLSPEMAGVIRAIESWDSLELSDFPAYLDLHSRVVAFLNARGITGFDMDVLQEYDGIYRQISEASQIAQAQASDREVLERRVEEYEGRLRDLEAERKEKSEAVRWRAAKTDELRAVLEGEYIEDSTQYSQKLWSFLGKIDDVLKFWKEKARLGEGVDESDLEPEFRRYRSKIDSIDVEGMFGPARDEIDKALNDPDGYIPNIEAFPDGDPEEIIGKLGLDNLFEADDGSYFGRYGGSGQRGEFVGELTSYLSARNTWGLMQNFRASPILQRYRARLKEIPGEREQLEADLSLAQDKMSAFNGEDLEKRIDQKETRLGEVRKELEDLEALNVFTIPEVEEALEGNALYTRDYYRSEISLFLQAVNDLIENVSEAGSYFRCVFFKNVESQSDYIKGSDFLSALRSLSIMDTIRKLRQAKAELESVDDDPENYAPKANVFDSIDMDFPRGVSKFSDIDGEGFCHAGDIDAAITNYERMRAEMLPQIKAYSIINAYEQKKHQLQDEKKTIGESLETLRAASESSPAQSEASPVPESDISRFESFYRKMDRGFSPSRYLNAYNTWRRREFARLFRPA